MAKQLSLLSPDGSAAPSPSYGSVTSGMTSASRAMILKNTGDTPIPSVRMHVEQASTLDGEYRVTVGSLTLTATNQEVLSAPLAVNASINISELVTVPAGLNTTGPDSGKLVWEYDQ